MLFQVDNVGIELNCRMSSWCLRIAHCGGKNLHVGIGARNGDHLTSFNPAHTECVEFRQILFIMHFFYVEKRVKDEEASDQWRQRDGTVLPAWLEPGCGASTDPP